MSHPEKDNFFIPTEKNQVLIGKAKALNHVPWCEAYEQMISGMLYQVSGIPEFESHIIRVVKLRRQYNNPEIHEDATFTSLRYQQREKLTAILGHLGNDSFVHAPFNALFGCNIWIGDNVVVNANFRVDDPGLVTLKDRALIGPSCQTSTGTHSLNYLERRRSASSSRPVEIGEDCWLGVGVIVLLGVTIGKGCVVTAGAVVARDVAPFTLVGGIPGKVIRYLGDPEEPGNLEPHEPGVESGNSGLEKGARSIKEGKDDENDLPGRDCEAGAKETDRSEPDLTWSIQTAQGSV